MTGVKIKVLVKPPIIIVASGRCMSLAIVITYAPNHNTVIFNSTAFHLCS